MLGLAQALPVIAIEKKLVSLKSSDIDMLRSLDLVCTSGGFDPLRPGHISYLLGASKLAKAHCVILNGDYFLERKKGRAFMSVRDRAIVVASLFFVDFVLTFESGADLTVIKPLAVMRPRIFRKGGDRNSAATIPEWKICEELGIHIALNIDDERWRRSSSQILERWKSG